MTEILNAIFDRLQSEVPELNFIDIDLEQLQLEPPPVDFPCALVDISEIEYNSGGRGIQTAQVDISVRLGFSLFTTSDANSEQRYTAMEHYDIVAKVAKALHGYSTEAFTPLVRTKLVRNPNTYPRTYSLMFKTSFKEDFNRPLTPFKAQLVVSNKKV